MDLSKKLKPITKLLNKYQFPAVLLLVGILLMTLPGRIGNQKTTKEVINQEEMVSTDIALGELLSKIDGAGDVEVLLSIASGEETIYQADEDLSVSDTSSTTRTSTITVTGMDRVEVGLVKQVNPPKYLGAVIICQGADHASVRLAIVDAVSKFTGLGADCISVLKMK